MTHALPVIVAALSAVALAAALYALFRSLRAALTGEGDVIALEALVSARRTTLLDEKEALLTGLRDLAADHEAGKTSDEDRAHSESRMRARAKAVLRALEEEIAPHRAAAEKLLALPKTIDPSAEKVAEEARADISEPREESAAEPSSIRTCFACGVKNDPDAAFCKKCGKPLGAEAAS